MFAALLLITACSNKTATEDKDASVKEQQEVEGVITEVVSEQEHNIPLVDNEDLKVTLIDSKHDRLEDYDAEDTLYLNLDVENKQNRTFNMYFDDISIDGSDEEFDIGMSETEIGPKDHINIVVNMSKNILNEDLTLTFEEHISGKIVYSDHEGNREAERFSEYVIEQE